MMKFPFIQLASAGKEDVGDKMLVIEKNGKRLAEVFTFLENPIGEKKEFVSKITDRISFRDDIGFAGHKDKKALENFLNWSIYGDTETNIWSSVTVNDCKEEIEFILEKCLQIIQDKIIKIFIFPTIDEFVIERMNGVSGFTPWKNTILLCVFRTENWKKALRDSVCHELAHALALNFNNRETIEDDLIFEGVAEHFREAFIDGEKASWVRSISDEKAKEILRDIKTRLKTRDDILYRELFFGTGKYPLWSGYSIGYYIVKAYLNKLTKKNWTKIIQDSPSEIVKKSDYLCL